MNTAPHELLKEYVKSQNFSSTAEIMEAMKEMFRDVIQTAMEVELDEELGRERCQRAEASETAPNYRNGYSRKTVKTQLGEVDIRVPRDRKGTYEPKLIGKYSRNADGMEEKILALYACGMSQRDIAEQVKELYDVDISAELVTKITEKIMPEVTAWQNRPLEKVYPFIFMDAIHYKVKEDHRYVTKAAYVVLGITMDGRKDILGVWIGEHESSKFWLNVLNDLKSRGVMDVYLFCTDGLCGMVQAIQAVYPNSRLQRCIVHQIRSSTRYVSWKDIKMIYPALGDLKMPDITPANISGLLLSMQSQGKAHATCIKVYTILHSLFKMAYIGDVVPVNPMDKVERPKPRKGEIKDKDVEFYSTEEVQRIFVALENEPLKWRTLMGLLIDTGIRRGECCGLQWKDIDFKVGTITIRGNLCYTPQKGIYLDTPKSGKVRIIDVDPEIIGLLQQLRLEQASHAISTYVFTQQDSPEPMHPQSPARYGSVDKIRPKQVEI